MMFLADYDNPSDGNKSTRTTPENKSTTPKYSTPEEAVFDHFKDYLGNLNYDEVSLKEWILHGDIFMP